MDREVVVAVHADRRQAVAQPLGRKGRVLRPCQPRKARNGPLVVDDVQDHRRAIGAGEGERLVEVALCGGAVADPGGRYSVVAGIGRGHGEADGLRNLRPQIAADGKEPVLPRRIHDRQLAAFDRVRGVGVDLVHHVDQGIAPGDQKPLLAIGGKAHVLAAQDVRLRAGDRLLPRALHVEAGLALPLRAVHPLVEGAGQDHRLQPVDLRLPVEIGRPRPPRRTLIIQHPDELEGHVPHGLGGRLHGRAAHLPCAGEGEAGEVGRLARATARLRNMQAQGVVRRHAAIRSGRDSSGMAHQTGSIHREMRFVQRSISRFSYF